MRKEKALISLLKELVDLMSEEAAQNPEFSRKLELLLSPLPAKKLAKRKRPAAAALDLPDVYREYNARGQAESMLEFRLPTVTICRRPRREQPAAA